MPSCIRCHLGQYQPRPQRILGNVVSKPWCQATVIRYLFTLPYRSALHGNRSLLPDKYLAQGFLNPQRIPLTSRSHSAGRCEPVYSLSSFSGFFGLFGFFGLLSPSEIGSPCSSFRTPQGRSHLTPYDFATGQAPYAFATGQTG